MKSSSTKISDGMDRRRFLKLTASGLAAGALMGCRGVSPGRRPNILFIPVDDLRPELGCYGHTQVKSPNIDRLAERGVVFRNAYCQSAVCNPSRASLLTGRRPDTIQVWDLRTDFRDTVPDVVTLPQYFRQQGYYTVSIGKIYHNTIPDPASWNERKYLDGFPFDPDAVYLTEKNKKIQEEKKQAILKKRQGRPRLDRFGHWYLKAEATEAPEARDNAYYDGAQTDWALDKLRKLKEMDQPFFLAVGYYRPHLPFNAPRKYWDLYDRKSIPLAANDFVPRNSPEMAINNLRELRGYTDFRHIEHPRKGKLSESEARLLKHGYLASVSYIDAQIGRLLDGLNTLHLSDITIVVLWGDHGWKLGEHNSWCKMTNYEVDTRVPLIISAPGTGSSGSVTSGLVEFVDIYPTLCDLAGLPLPSGLEGYSMSSLMQHPGREWKKAVFSQFLREGIWVGPSGEEHMGYSIRTKRFRYVEWIHWRSGELRARELYDLKTDPRENINIIRKKEMVNTVHQLQKMLRAGWKGALPE